MKKIVFTLALISIFIYLIADPFNAQVGTFNGVPAYSNEYVDNVTDVYNNYNGQNTGMKWQCVEYVNRYYLTTYGINIRVPGHNANMYYPNATAHGLYPYANGNTNPPEVGDIICSNSGNYGHVALVREVGPNYIKVIQQNWSNSSADNNFQLSLSSANGIYTVGNFNAAYSVAGWLKRSNSQSNMTCQWYVTPFGGTQTVLPSNYIFWNEYSYTISGTVTGFIDGEPYAVCIYNSDDVYVTYPISNQQNSTFSFEFGGLAATNGTGFRFKLVPQFIPSQPYAGTESNPWNTGPYPVLNLSSISGLYTQGSELTISWSISGGIDGLVNGGWASTANLRFQWYQNDSPSNNVAGSVPLTDWSRTIIVDHEPGNNYQIGVCNIGTNSALPDGIPSAFTSYFQILYPIGNDDNCVTITSPNIRIYPNPFKGSTTIEYNAEKNSLTTIDIYNGKGQHIRSIINNVPQTGINTAKWFGTDDNLKIVPSGLYFMKITIGKSIYVRKIIVM